MLSDMVIVVAMEAAALLTTPSLAFPSEQHSKIIFFLQMQVRDL